MGDTPQALPQAPEDLQTQFTDLQLHRFAYDGVAPKAILVKTLKDNPKLLAYTFKGYDGQKTNLLAELIRADRPVLALTVLRELKDAVPEAMIKGYKPDDASPAINPLALAVRKSSSLATELMEQGAGIDNITPDGDNIFHAMMAKSSPATVKALLEYVEKKVPEDRRKELFAAKNSAGKTPLELMVYPPNLVPLVEKQYISKSEMESLGGKWLDRKRDALLAKTTYDEEFSRLVSDVVNMHEAFRKAGIKHPVSYRVGEKIIEFGRADVRTAGYGVSQIGMLAEYADSETRNQWLAKTVAYQGDMRFPVMASLALMDKGARPADQGVFKNAIYAEEIVVVGRALDACRNNPALLDNGSDSSLSYAITCAFAAEQKRLPIAALLVESGAKVTKASYHDPMGSKIANLDLGGQCAIADKCQKLCLPYPEGLDERLQNKWAEIDKAQAPTPKTLQDRANLMKDLRKWQGDDKMRRLLKNATGFAPGIVPAPDLAAANTDVNALTAAFPAALRSLVRS